MKLAALPVLLLSFPFLALGCAAQSESADDGVDVEAAEADVTSASNFGYFRVTSRDLRRCAAPHCGGFYVKRVNEATTVCADGKRAAECYVSSIQLDGIGLSAREEAEVRTAVESGKALIKARTYKQSSNGVTIGQLKANEVWVGATGSEIDGDSFYRLADNGVRCIQAPCPSTTADALNGHDSYKVSNVKLDQTQLPAEQDELDRASQAVGTKDGLLVAGVVALPKCVPNSNCGPRVNVHEFYLRVVPTEGKSCGGFVANPLHCNSGQFCQWEAKDMCGAADAPGKCAYKPQACIRLYSPVCGCDGKTYGNFCMANAAGTSVSSEGECKP